MDTSYTFTAAAKLLQVSRQTLYRHVDKEPDRYVTVTADGQRRISLPGLALLKEQIQKPVTGEASSITLGNTQTQQESDSAGHRDRELQEAVMQERHRADLLQVQLDAARERIASLEATTATLGRALDQEQVLHRQTQQTMARRGLFARIFGKSEQKIGE